MRGAVVLVPHGEPYTPGGGHHSPLDDADLAARVRALPEHPLGTEPARDVRMSLAGAQPKLLLARFDGRRHEPVAGAASTHILKPTTRWADSAHNEALVMAVARDVGLTPAAGWVEQVGGTAVFVAERYDRIVTGPHQVRRRHQEDLYQAIGLRPGEKDRIGRPSERMARLLREQTDDPATALLELYRQVCFRVVVGDEDGHGKNDGGYLDEGRVTLAAFYDGLGTLVHPDLNGRRGTPVDRQQHLAEVDRPALLQKAASAYGGWVATSRWADPPRSADAPDRAARRTAIGDNGRMQLPVMPPVAPMLAKAVPEIPEGDLSYEPKWDGFRSIIFRDGDEVEIGSRNEKPMTRYFPEVVAAVLQSLPERCVVDGEIVVVVGDRLEFEVLQQRIHPAASRVRLLAAETPASFIAFDLLAEGDTDWTGRPFAERRTALEAALAGAEPPVHLTPVTRDHAEATGWFSQFEGAGLDGVVAKPLAGLYQPDKRTMFKIKHQRTADCVVAGYRVHKSGPNAIGSLLLGLYNDDGELASVGVIGAFPAARRKELFTELQPLVTTFDDHPWAWAKQEEGARTPRNSEYSRWNNGKDLSFTPLRPELVVEVRYEHMEGVRFRHTAQFNRWRPDREPRSCTYAQLEEPVRFDLADILRVPSLDGRQAGA